MSAAAFGSAARVKWNTDPCSASSGTDSTQIGPPWRSTMRMHTGQTDTVAGTVAPAVQARLKTQADPVVGAMAVALADVVVPLVVDDLWTPSASHAPARGARRAVLRALFGGVRFFS